MRASPAALATAATIAAVAALAAIAKGASSQYVASLYKGSLERLLDESLGPFYIPDGQCSGVLDDLLSCRSGGDGGGKVAAGVRVSVEDAAPFPLVALHDSLQRASVLRAQPCRGEATVTVRLACQDLLGAAESDLL